MPKTKRFTVGDTVRTLDRSHQSTIEALNPIERTAELKSGRIIRLVDLEHVTRSRQG